MVGPGAFAQLLVLVPGETGAPGSPTGKTGSPSTQTANAPFTVTVPAVDASVEHRVRHGHGRHHVLRRERRDAPECGTRRRDGQLPGHAADERIR